MRNTLLRDFRHIVRPERKFAVTSPVCLYTYIHAEITQTRDGRDQICSTTRSEGNRRARQARRAIEESCGVTEGGKREAPDESREARKLKRKRSLTAILFGRMVETSV